MSDVTLRDHGLRVAVLKIISDETARVYKTARGDAEMAFGPAREEGQSQQRALLPDGTEIGLFSIKDGGKDVAVPEAALEAWVEAHLPDGFEETADERALTDAEVIDVLKAVFPHLVRRRIRPATRAALLKEIEDSGGWLIDQTDGSKEKLGDVTDRKATGEFAFRTGKGAREAVIDAWRRGDLMDVPLGPLALPAPAEAPEGDGAS